MKSTRTPQPTRATNNWHGSPSSLTSYRPDPIHQQSFNPQNREFSSDNI
jgi:hypothetical protein